MIAIMRENREAVSIGGRRGLSSDLFWKKEKFLIFVYQCAKKPTFYSPCLHKAKRQKSGVPLLALRCCANRRQGRREALLLFFRQNPLR
ncbi:hypothetical protein ACR6A7_10945 [Pantoea sp. RRHST58]|uniref:hypothetical protein n=1 Tax=Pantoea sp. RRHST58 TaxID=3425183 RepID=UPI003DA19707